MRWRGVSHVDLAVPDEAALLAFYDRMFGWLGYASFSTLGVSYTATYYLAGRHSYIGIHPRPAADVEPGRSTASARRPGGLHHLALWARSRREVDHFHARFLVAEAVEVTDPPAEYPLYWPGYYAVFFRCPAGIRWELARMPLLPGPAELARFLRTMRKLRRAHPEWRHHPIREAWRRLPRRRR